MAYGLRAKISPGVELNDIHIHLTLDGPPAVRLEGAVRHARTRQVIGRATIDTGVLGPAGVRFITELKEAFGSAYPPTEGKPARERDSSSITASMGRVQGAT